MNRTRGFVNLNRFKSGRAIKRLKSVPDKDGDQKLVGVGEKLYHPPRRGACSAFDALKLYLA